MSWETIHASVVPCHLTPCQPTSKRLGRAYMLTQEYIHKMEIGMQWLSLSLSSARHAAVTFSLRQGLLL